MHGLIHEDDDEIKRIHINKLDEYTSEDCSVNWLKVEGRVITVIW
jgi:hypothetical protein